MPITHPGNRIMTNTLSLTALAASFLMMNAANAAANKPPVVTTQTTLANNLQGVTGNLAINRFGDVFEASTFEGVVYEYPASGAARIPVFTLGPAFSGKGLGGVAVDTNDNIYVTTIYVGAQTNTSSTPSDSAIYELPFVSGAYPAPYTYSAAPAPTCSTTPTAVCAWGNFLQVTGYYYQGWDFAMDGNGTGYLVTLFDNNSPKNNIYACNTACEARTQGASILVGNLPNAVLSIAADSAGDVFYADGSANVYEVPAGASAPIILGGGFSNTIGVALDRAGNLFITDKNALYEIPKIAGVYNPAAVVQVVPLGGGSVRGYNGGGIGVDTHGNVYAATGFANLFKLTVNSGIFPPAAATTGSSTLTFTVVLNQTISGATVTPAGAQAGDFAISGSTCAAAANPGSTCTFTGTFTPGGVGRRKAGLVIADSAGDVTNVAVAGTGQGAGLTIDPGTVTQTGANFQAAAGVAVDGAGNKWIVDTKANAVYKYPAGGGARTTVGTGLVSPVGVAVDGFGSIYIGDTGAVGTTKGRVVQVTPAGLQSTVATGLATPSGLFVDGSGTLYVADSTNKNVLALPATQFGQPGGVTFGTALIAPSDVVVDGAGTFLIADPGANQVIRISAEGVQSSVGSGFSAPSGVTFDASGSVIVADQGNKRIVRVPNEAGVLNPNDETSIQTGIASPYVVRIDSGGNLVVSDNTANVLDTVNRTAATVAFSAVNVGTTSAAQTGNLSSEGNLPLPLNAPLYTPPSPPFALMQGSPTCTPGTNIAAGSGCLLSATFTPTSKSTSTTMVQFSTSAQNAATTSLTLTGTGLQLATATVTLVQTSPASGSPAYGQTVTLTATISGSAANGGTPTGTAALVINGSIQPSVQVVNGTATFTVMNLSGGVQTFEAEYFGDNNYAAAHSANLVLTVSQASAAIALAITADATAPLSAASGSPVTFNATLTPSTAGFFSGTVNFVSGSTVLATASVQTAPGGIYTASVTSTTLPLGTYSVTAVYSGNANYASSSSTPAMPLIIVATPTLVVTSGSPKITSSASSPGSALVTVTSLAGFQGGVTFSCQGLPVNAVCQFNPAILTMLASNGGKPFIVPTQNTVLTVLIGQSPVVTQTGISLWSALVLLLAFPALRRMRKSWKLAGTALASVALLLAMSGGLSGCGSGNNFNTPAGTSTITVTATATPSIPATAPTSSAGTVMPTLSITLVTQ
jgi:sugar lactone lactonase YvrE